MEPVPASKHALKQNAGPAIEVSAPVQRIERRSGRTSATGRRRPRIRWVPILLVGAGLLLAPFFGPVAYSAAVQSGVVPFANPGHPPGPGGAPQLGPNVRFTVPSTTPTASPSIGTNKGDAIFVWFAIANRGTVSSITDSFGDHFGSVAPQAYTGPFNGSRSFAIWSATNVVGGNDRITVTLAPMRQYLAVDAAVVAYDVRGVGPNPVDQLGPVESSYAQTKGGSDAFAAPVWAGANDLVLAGVAAASNPAWKQAGPVHPVASQTATLSGSSTPSEIATFQQPGGGSWDYAWNNGTVTSPVTWVAEALTVMSASASETKYPITFSESGIAAGTAWSATLIGATTTAVAPSSITFSERSGSYLFSVGAARYAATPMGGTVTVSGAPVSESSKFVQAPPIQHVVVIPLENLAAATVLAGGPYQRYLANTYADATNFYSACHYSYPNYAAMTSGRYFACGTASIPIEGVANLGDLLDGAGQSWMGYFESMSSACQFASSGDFASYHDPFILYKDIRYNSARCDQHIVNSAQFNSSVAAGSLPAYSLYVPNLKDDCETSSLAFCDSWLKGFLGGMLNSTDPKVQTLMGSTAFFITYDEANAGDSSGYLSAGHVNSWCQQATGHQLSVCGGHIYSVVVSPYSRGLTYSTEASLYNLQTTVEWLLGVVGNDGGWDGTPAFPAMTGVFSPPPSTYSVEFDESGLSGQNWSVTLTSSGGSSTTQSSAGASILFQEPNGTYSYSVGAPSGYTAQPSSGSVAVAGQSPAKVLVKFSPPTTYAVTFDETGLTGQSWSVTLTSSTGATSTLSSTAGSITFQEQNGTYSYTITAPSGFMAVPSSGSVTVAGQAPSAVEVVFAPQV